MIRSHQRKKKKQFDIYEHLEHYVKKTTYTHRMQWLEEANRFVWQLKEESNDPYWKKTFGKNNKKKTTKRR